MRLSDATIKGSLKYIQPCARVYVHANTPKAERAGAHRAACPWCLPPCAFMRVSAHARTRTHARVRARACARAHTHMHMHKTGANTRAVQLESSTAEEISDYLDVKAIDHVGRKRFSCTHK